LSISEAANRAASTWVSTIDPIVRIVRRNLAEKSAELGITAPLYMTQNDGTLMGAETVSGVWENTENCGSRERDAVRCLS
jgi:N-methylhydantoinase A/oxoprolinase/acetone carboxylase beta subunit